MSPVVRCVQPTLEHSFRHDASRGSAPSGKLHLFLAPALLISKGMMLEPTKERAMPCSDTRGFTLMDIVATTNYDAILIGWESQKVQNNIDFHGGNSQYSPGAAAEARGRLISEHNWTINDGGEVQ